VLSVGSAVAMVRNLFPERSDEVSRLAMWSNGFRATCHDYGLAVETLGILERRDHPADAERIHDYRVLISDLTHDLEWELLASGSSTGSSTRGRI
jgi:hypothetical protein